MAPDNPQDDKNDKKRKREDPTANSDDTDSSDVPLARLAKQRKKTPHPKLPPAEYWDGLSRVPLSKTALVEFDKREVRMLPPTVKCSTARAFVEMT